MHKLNGSSSLRQTGALINPSHLVKRQDRVAYAFSIVATIADAHMDGRRSQLVPENQGSWHISELPKTI